ncbi:sodium-coupled monocarboxylate transporter 2 [Procambarus clarkii]|uniref:sodium-coupled monocarboxylate transporter 2 n=1 Tax=Procambarus clarkii TaxID=6728 RepID=UPI001E67041B|nr:sodium-coupled monocarboxylate transporter 2-like [Procambarus clarkii]XP_045600690.1 sodium-coupled monocarboxylate transporter 2-like [Procambarus clarkii]
MTVSVTELADRFTWIDYMVFGLMLALSAAIGIFYGCFSKKQDTKEFLMAGKSMTTFPVAMSLIASFMSAITLLGTPSEVYQFGFIYWLIGFSYIAVMPAAAYLYFPVFYKLQVTSAYEYLEKRFHRAVRWLGSFVFIIQMSLYMAIVVYAPALALAQVTGFDVYVSVSLICFVCIFYTTLGGMKAVLWTDALQTLIMYASMMFVIIKGAVDVGGFSAVWERNVESGRAQLIDFDPDPTTRHTFWTLVIGGYFTWITIYGVNQAQVQRYLSVQTRQMAVNALWVNLVGLFVLMITCSFGGMVVYAKYYDCDPIRAGVVTKGDQLFPLFVMDTLGQWKGLPGLFVAGIFAGALSTVSSGLNSLAAIVLEDFIKSGCYPGISDTASTWVSRGLCVFFGLITFALVFVAEQLGNILSAALSIFGMVGGPLLGVFTLGMFFPWANAIGAFVGEIVSLIFMFWIGVGHQVARSSGQIKLVAMPTSIDGCQNLTITEPPFIYVPEGEEPGEALALYRLSYMWYSATGCFTVIIVGMLVTLVTGKQDVRAVDPRCLSPAVMWFKNWLPGLNGLGEDYIDEEDELRESKSSSSFGNTNPSFTPEMMEKTYGDYTPEKESSKL